MKTIFIIALLISLVSCNGSGLKVRVDTAGVKEPANQRNVGLVLNESIEDASASIDKDKGTLTIEFDYPSQKWSAFYGDYPITFLVRLFDKNGQYLTHFETREKFAPISFKEAIKKKNPEGYSSLLGGALSKSVDILEKGNKLTYQLNKIVADSVSIVEFGWNAPGWFSKDNEAGYWFKYPKTLADDKCYSTVYKEVFTMGKDVRKFGEICTMYTEGKFVKENDVISVVASLKCGRQLLSEDQCCIDWQEKSVFITNDMYKDKETGICKCNDDKLVPEQLGSPSYPARCTTR